MTPVYLIDRRGDIRRERATTAEIEEFVTGRGVLGYSALAHVTLEDGAFVVTPLDETALCALGNGILHRKEQELRRMLTLAFELQKMAGGLSGVTSSSNLCVMAEDAPWAERVVREWAESTPGVELEGESMPRDPKVTTWIPALWIRHDYYSFARVQWPKVQLGETVLAVESLCHAIASLGAESKEAA